MFKRYFIYLFLLFFFNSGYSQLIRVGKGWSQNSINAVVFRKNSVVSYKENQYVAYYDSSGFITLAKRKRDTEVWEIRTTQYMCDISDAHRSISLMLDGDGYLHIAWNHHVNHLNYSRSVEPELLELSERLIMIGDLENKVTYPEFYKFPNGDLLFLYRDGSSGKGNLVINRYLSAEKKWIRIQDVLIDGEGQRNAYWQAAVDKTGTFHVSWVWRESGDVATNHDLCYARSSDFGISWQKSTGENYHIPISQATAEYALKIPQNSELINQTSMYADDEGNPYIATYFRPNGSPIPQYHLIFKTGDKWESVQVSNRNTPFSLKGGGTKKIPISRPQIIIEKKGSDARAILIYRDIEQGNKVSAAISESFNFNKWDTYNLTDFSVESWEPSYDTELWNVANKLHIYVQKVGQGDGETLEEMAQQPVFIYEVEEF